MILINGLPFSAEHGQVATFCKILNNTQRREEERKGHRNAAATIISRKLGHICDGLWVCMPAKCEKRGSLLL